MFLRDEIGPKLLKSLSEPQLVELAEEIRRFLIETISKTGGHIGANLGTIEISIALHKVFDSPGDKLIFDTGHQGYTHKILTGRASTFATLNTFGGMSRFLTRSESVHDVLDASHAGTAISIATGIALARRHAGHPGHVVAVVGDGSLVEGMSFEGLNYAATSQLKLILLVNDNEMAIAPSVGGMRHLMTGKAWSEKSKAFFEGLGFSYLPVPDGHNIGDLAAALERARGLGVPAVVHTKTEKGRGLPFARSHPYKMHFSMPFDAATGQGAAPTVSGKTFGAAAAEELGEIMAQRKDVVVITPATPYASYLQRLFELYPERAVDVGMAEQHAVGLACGLAMEGAAPVVCFQTTFMQRAFDQLIHDAAYMNLPVTVLGVRSGFSGYDSPTHHGVYDLPYLRSIPNLQICYPYSPEDMRQTLRERLNDPRGPMLLLHPYEVLAESVEVKLCGGPPLSCLDEGTDGAIFFLSNCCAAARRLRELLKQSAGAEFALHCLKAIKPTPAEEIAALCRGLRRVVTIEESTLHGGLGSILAEVFADRKLKADLLRLGVPDIFVPAGSKDECRRSAGLSDDDLVEQVVQFWPELAPQRQEAAACKD